MIIDIEKLFKIGPSFWSKLKIKIVGILLFHNTWTS